MRQARIPSAAPKQASSRYKTKKIQIQDSETAERKGFDPVDGRCKAGKSHTSMGRIRCSICKRQGAYLYRRKRKGGRVWEIWRTGCGMP